MPAYSYTAIDSNGNKKKSITNADSERQARQYIRELGFTPYSVELAAQKETNNKTSSIFTRLSLTSTELALITRQMGTMLTSGLPLDEALLAAASQTDSNKTRKLLASVRSTVLEGGSLATAFSAYPSAFPRMYCATVAAGEKSGNLGIILERLAEYTESSADFQQKILAALVYPILLSVISILVVSGLMIYVVPDIIQVFIDSGQELPALTKGLLVITERFEDYGLWFLLILLTLFVALVKLVKIPLLKLKIDRIFLKAFFLKKFSRTFNAIRYVSTLHILNSSGVTLVEGMKIAQQVVPNTYLRHELAYATKNVTEGVSLSNALKNIPEFPTFFIHMIKSGEKSGRLDEMLYRAYSTQEKELQRWISTMVSLFEPMTLVVMGSVVMVIVLAILLPILNMNQMVV